MNSIQAAAAARSLVGCESDRSLVKVENDDGRLRLRFSYGGKRYALAVGLPDSKVNRIVAQQKATQIELDIASGNFDPTLRKYKPPKAAASKSAAIQVAELFQQFMEAQTKAKGLQVGSLCRYTATLRHLEKFFANWSADTVDESAAEAFVEYLQKQVSERTTKDYLILVQSCWKWAPQPLSHNPWSHVLGQIKPPPQQKVKPFTMAEVQAILAAFKTDRYYRHYADFVAFLFGTGCRLGEAVALQWKHVADDCSTVWIGESVSRGIRKTTKTGKDRTLTLTPKIAALLEDRKPENVSPDNLVFPAPSGKPINTDFHGKERTPKNSD